MAEKDETSAGLVCPDCGVPMKGLDPYGHSLVHYPEYLDPAKSSMLARKHQQLIQEGGVTLATYQADKAKVG